MIVFAVVSWCRRSWRPFNLGLVLVEATVVAVSPSVSELTCVLDECTREETQQANATSERNKRTQQANATKDSKCIKASQQENNLAIMVHSRGFWGEIM
jgi:hypothetical protein